MSEQGLLKKFSVSFILNLLVKLFWILGIEVAVQNRLGTEVYGNYFELFQFTFLFFILLDLGLSNYNSRTVAADPEAVKAHFSAMLNIKLGLSVLYLILLFMAALLVGYDSRQQAVVIFIGINQALLSFILFLRSTVSGLHLFNTDSVLSVLDRFITGLLCAGLIWLGFPSIFGSFGLYDFLGAQLVGYTFTVLAALLIVYRKGARIRLGWNQTLFLDIIRKSYPFAILFTLMTLYTRIDAVMISAILGDQGDYYNGLYASAFRLLDAALIFSVLLSNILLPMFSRMLSQGESPEGIALVGFRTTLVAAVVLSAGCYCFAEPIYQLLYHEHVTEGSAVFGLLFLNFIPMSLGYVFGTLLTAAGELRWLNIVSAGGVVLNVVLNLFLIQEYQTIGAIYATILTQTMVTAVSFWMASKKFRFRIYDFLHFRVLLFVVLVWFTMAFLSGSAENFSWLARLSVSVIVCLAYALVLKVMDVKSWMKSLGGKT